MQYLSASGGKQRMLKPISAYCILSTMNIIFSAQKCQLQRCKTCQLVAQLPKQLDKLINIFCLKLLQILNRRYSVLFDVAPVLIKDRLMMCTLREFAPDCIKLFLSCVHNFHMSKFAQSKSSELFIQDGLCVTSATQNLSAQGTTHM